MPQQEPGKIPEIVGMTMQPIEHALVADHADCWFKSVSLMMQNGG